MLKGWLEEEKEKEKKKNRGKQSNNKMALNTYLSIINHLKCKWLKCYNQKT